MACCGVIGWVAAVPARSAGPLPSPSLPSLTPLPTLSPSPPALPSATPLPLPTLAPLAPLPSPGVAAPVAPGSSGTTSGPPPATPPPAYSAGLPASLSAVADAIPSPALLAELAGVLAHPVSRAAPDLHHFRLSSARSDPSGGGLVAATQRAARDPIVLALAGLTLACVLLTLGARWGARPLAPGRRKSRARAALALVCGGLLRRAGVGAASLPVGLLLALGAAGGAAASAAVAHAPTAAATPNPAGRSTAAAPVARLVPPMSLTTTTHSSPARIGAVHDSDATAPPTPAASPSPSPAPHGAPATAVPAPVSAGAGAWNRLVNIERRLIATQDALVADEARIQTLTAAVAVATMSTDATAFHAVPRDADALRAALAAHDQLAAAYQQALADEYAVYRGVAPDQQASAAMLQAASPAGPAVHDAVAYNLQVVATQLAQEQAISSAVGPLALAPSAPPGAALLAPVIAPVTQPFGRTAFALEPPLTYGGVFYPHFHTGVDLAAPFDSPVRAAADGVVVLAGASVDRSGHLVGYGNYVVIDGSDGLVTLYGHLDRLLVHAGDTVKQGQPIGLEGTTGWSTGPHVHFEVRQGDTPVDPLPYIASQLASG